jgi:hypothetical protein
LNCTALNPFVDNTTYVGLYSSQSVYLASNGCSNNGGLHFSGNIGETAFGGRPSATVPTVRFGIGFKNNTGQLIKSIKINFTEEQWAKAEQGSGRTAVCEYAVVPLITNVAMAASYIFAPSFNLTPVITPNLSCTGGLNLLASPPATRAMSAVFYLNWNPGDELLFRWTYLNGICNEDALLIDDLTILAYEYSLPVELIDFRCTKEKNGISVNWSTASEINNDYFKLEKSYDGNNYEFLAQINGNGNSTNIINYSLLDKNPKNGINYYKLTQVDFDGTSKTYDPIAIDWNQKLFEISLENNNGNVIFTINSPNNNEEMEMIVYDLLGQIIDKQNLKLIGGINKFEMHEYKKDQVLIFKFLKIGKQNFEKTFKLKL